MPTPSLLLLVQRGAIPGCPKERARSTREAPYRVLVALMRGRRPASPDLATLNAEIGTVRGRDRRGAR